MSKLFIKVSELVCVCTVCAGVAITTCGTRSRGCLTLVSDYSTICSCTTRHAGQFSLQYLLLFALYYVVDYFRYTLCHDQSSL